MNVFAAGAPMWTREASGGDELQIVIVQNAPSFGARRLEVR